MCGAVVRRCDSWKCRLLYRQCWGVYCVGYTRRGVCVASVGVSHVKACGCVWLVGFAYAAGKWW